MPTRAEKVFVLGAPRSGTTVISAALRSVGYAGAHEGHILHVLQRISAAVEWHYEIERHWLGKHGWMIDSVDKDWLISASSEPLLRRYEEVVGAKCWIDKTPGAEAIAAVQALRKILPGARFIFCHRRGIEHVNSYLRRFGKGEAMFEEACATWASTMLERLLLPEDPKSPVFDIPHSELVRDPASVADGLAEFLCLSSKEAEDLKQFFNQESPERTGDDFEWKPLRLTPWSKEQKRRFLTVCGPAMLANGYWFEAENEEETAGIVYHPIALETGELSSSSPDYARRLDDHSFLLHPGVPGDPPTTATVDVPRRGYNILWINCKVQHLQSPLVEVSVVLRTTGGDLLFSGAVTLTPMRSVNQSWFIPSALDDLRLTVTAKVAPGEHNNLFAWCTIKELGLGRVPSY